MESNKCRCGFWDWTSEIKYLFDISFGGISASAFIWEYLADWAASFTWSNFELSFDSGFLFYPYVFFLYFVFYFFYLQTVEYPVRSCIHIYVANNFFRNFFWYSAKCLLTKHCWIYYVWNLIIFCAVGLRSWIKRATTNNEFFGECLNLPNFLIALWLDIFLFEK